ncbi:hypothetical protein Acal02_02142 [Acinetobacter calcoaceticus]
MVASPSEHLAPEMEVPDPFPLSVPLAANAAGEKLIAPTKTAAVKFEILDLVLVLLFASSEVATHAPIDAFQTTLYTLFIKILRRLLQLLMV